MFESLDEEIESTEGGRPKVSDRLLRYAGVAVLSLIVFGGLCLVIVALE
jgi:hypothetical protein